MTTDSVKTSDYAISPWTRDISVAPSHWQNLFSLGKELMPAKFKAKLDEIKE